MKRSVGFLLTVLTLAALISSGPATAKPPRNPPPPPPPPDPTVIYQWRPDLGGILDTQTNLVWGYSFYDLKGYGITQAMATSAAADYADILYDIAEFDIPAFAAQNEAAAEERQAQGDAALAAGDVELANRYYARAQEYRDKADADLDSIPLYMDAADVADQFTWRLPTQQEAQRAIGNGLFTYGDGGFNGYDATPRIGFSPVIELFTWTTTKVKKNVWVFKPLSGAGVEAGVNSQINAIFVRTHVP